MHSRTRKVAKTDSDFETLHRQLNSDFEVHLYLKDQPSQQYSTSYPVVTPTHTHPSSTTSSFIVGNELNNLRS